MISQGVKLCMIAWFQYQFTSGSNDLDTLGHFLEGQVAMGLICKLNYLDVTRISYVTVYAKTVPIGTTIEIHFMA